MSEGKSLWARIAKEGLTEVLIEGVKWVITWLSPLLLAAMTVVTGYTGELPWVYIIPLATFTFAATAVGLLRFDEWMFRRTPRDKLSFRTIYMGLEYVRDPTSGRPTALAKAQVQIILQSSAHFQISYIVEELRTSVDGRVNSTPKISTRGAMVSLGGESYYRDDVIEMEGSPTKSILAGTAEFKIRYGRKGAEKYLIDKKINISCTFDPVAGRYVAVNWVDAPQEMPS